MTDNNNHGASAPIPDPETADRLARHVEELEAENTFLHAQLRFAQESRAYLMWAAIAGAFMCGCILVAIQ